ncbi:hypothetical protein EYV94_23610 [Puteibacter caeruleilacunae]|nr:hypothetical protein EYV94_23610 [Puteibacter caeruleilacunae]
MDNRIFRITILWILILIGLIYHTILHLTPAFYGIDIVKHNATGQMPLSMIITFGLTYVIPVIAIVVINYLYLKVAWKISFILAVWVLLINTGHMSELFIATRHDPTQLFVLIPELLLAILLVADSWKLRKCL